MGALDEVSTAIGSLTARLDTLADDMRKHAVVSQDTHDNLVRLNSKVDGILVDMEAMRPVVEKVKKWEQRAIAIAAAGSVVGSLFWERLFSTIKGWFA